MAMAIHPFSGCVSGESRHPKMPFSPAKRFALHVSFDSLSLASRSPHFLVRYSSSASLGDIKRKGEECYQLAVDALDNASRVKEEHEEQLMQEQFEAMKKQTEKKQQREILRQRERKEDSNANETKDRKAVATKDRAAGVAVLRTIVKQTQQQNAVHVENSFGDQSKDSTVVKTSDDKANIINSWRLIAQKHMEEAAFRYGHGSALVRLGNEALERAKNDPDKKWLIDRERCEAWREESPLNLAHLLVIGARMEGGTSDPRSDCDLDNMQGAEPVSPYVHLALHVYEEAGKQGSAEGWYNFGHLLWEQGADAQKDARGRAMDAFHEAMKLGDADAMYFVASQYLSREEDDEDGNEQSLASTCELVNSLGNSLELPPIREQCIPSSLKNETQQLGFKLLHLVAHGHNHGPALHHLALYHLQEGRYEDFRQRLSKAATAGHPESLFLQGHCYYTGTDGYGRDFPAALKNFLAAADSEHADAMVSAGAMLHRGVFGDDGRTTIIPRDQQRAFDLYQQAGELGSVEGWRNVVSCYASGQGVPKCLETAKYIAKTCLEQDKIN